MEIIATVGEKSWPFVIVEKMVRSDVDYLRYNASRSTTEQMTERVAILRTATGGASSHPKLLIDLGGGKLRLGRIPEFSVKVTLGSEFTFRSGSSTSAAKDFVPVDCEDVGRLVSPNDTFTLADGETAFVVTEICDAASFKAKAINDGYVVSTRGINLAASRSSRGLVDSSHSDTLNLAFELGADALAISFVESASNISDMRAFIECRFGGWHPEIIGKIETPAGVGKADAIAQVCDKVMIARGDLALTGPMETMGVSQMRIEAACRRQNTAYFVATQIFGDSSEYYTPNRSGILEITRVCRDPLGGIMFGSETSYSEKPERVIELARKIELSVQNAGHF